MFRPLYRFANCTLLEFPCTPGNGRGRIFEDVKGRGFPMPFDTEFSFFIFAHHVKYTPETNCILTHQTCYPSIGVSNGGLEGGHCPPRNFLTSALIGPITFRRLSSWIDYYEYFSCMFCTFHQ